MPISASDEFDPWLDDCWHRTNAMIVGSGTLFMVIDPFRHTPNPAYCRLNLALFEIGRRILARTGFGESRLYDVHELLTSLSGCVARLCISREEKLSEMRECGLTIFSEARICGYEVRECQEIYVMIAI